MTRDELLAEYAKGRRDFYEANLSGANLYGANLYGANLSRADLSGARLPHFQLCPEVGAFSAFKALCGGVYAELVIPADAPRTSSLVGRKCRAAWVEVVALYTRDGTMLPRGTVGEGSHDGTAYRAGATVIADGWDDDSRVECTHGIHFFMTLAEAHAYYA